MARHDPLLPNAAIIARREYLDRVRGGLFRVSTVVLMGLAVLITLSPIAIRYIDRGSVARIAIVSGDAELAARARAVADSVLNVMPAGEDRETWERPFVVDIAGSGDEAEAALRGGRLAGFIRVERLATGQLDVVFRTTGSGQSLRSQLVAFAATAVAILDWTAELPPDSQLQPFQAPAFRVDPLNPATEAGRPLDAQETASRAFLGIVFVVLLFLTVVIYGMWVATGVAAEKSSRVMELMISAASPRQMLTGKVFGIGAAGLTQYLAIVVPALLMLAFQDRIAEAILGQDWASGAPLVGLTPLLLAGYGTYLLLGFVLFALIYAALGSFVSRPDDLQTLSLPFSLLAVTGYLVAFLVLNGTSGIWITIASVVPPFSPFVMLARLMVGAVAPLEIALSIALLAGAIVVVALVATRMYAAGVLLYGQRPGIRAFVAAARRAG